VSFLVPGSLQPALTRGFGSVFTDVDLANTTSLQFFGANNENLGTFFTPASAGNATLSFLGVDFQAPIVSRVRITSGNAALSPTAFDSGGIDLVAMDDFIYGEPLAAVPGPIAGAGLPGVLLGVVGLLAWKGRLRRWARRVRRSALDRRMLFTSEQSFNDGAASELVCCY
jgi:hypothetical protein